MRLSAAAVVTGAFRVKFCWLYFEFLVSVYAIHLQTFLSCSFANAQFFYVVVFSFA